MSPLLRSSCRWESCLISGREGGKRYGLGFFPSSLSCCNDRESTQLRDGHGLLKTSTCCCPSKSNTAIVTACRGVVVSWCRPLGVTKQRLLCPDSQYVPLLLQKSQVRCVVGREIGQCHCSSGAEITKKFHAEEAVHEMLLRVYTDLKEKILVYLIEKVVFIESANTKKNVHLKSSRGHFKLYVGIFIEHMYLSAST